MGLLAIGFTAGLFVGCIAWYRFYTSGELERRGAIFHVDQRLGEQRFDGLERELMTIIHARTQSEGLSYEALIARSAVIELADPIYDRDRLSALLAQTAAERFDNGELIARAFADFAAFRPVGNRVLLSINTPAGVAQPELIVCRLASHTTISVPTADAVEDPQRCCSS